VALIFSDLQARGWLEERAERWRLTPQGVLLSNRVFEACTFLA
jgi:coproporphyrinogen III oxidase-like Fe-S oxidoreductase